MTQIIQGRPLPWNYNVSANGVIDEDYRNVMGFAPSIAADGNYHDLMDFGDHTPIAFRTPKFLKWSSADAGDGGITCELIGLDQTAAFIVVQDTLGAGQTEEAFGSIKFTRVFEFRVVGAQVPLGDMWLYVDDTVVAGVPQTQSKKHALIVQGMGTTRMGFYTIPLGMRGEVKGYTLGASSAQAIAGRMQIRGGLATEWQTIGPSGGQAVDFVEFAIPIRLTALTDIRVQAQPLVSAASISTEFSVTLRTTG